MANPQFIVADRGGHAYAMPLTQVVRVTMSPRICEVPLCPAGYVGVIDFEGAAIPIWDPFPEAADAMWGATVIVAESAGGRVGFLSDAPPQVQSGTPVPAPSAGSASSDASLAEEGFPQGIMWIGGVLLGPAVVPVLDPSRFGDRKERNAQETSPRR